MSFYKIPQNYAPGFVPQRYTFINDAAAATLTARLTDTRTAESVAELVLRDLWMPEIDVSAFLRRMAAALPFETGATGLYAPTTRTMTLSLAIGSDKAPDRIFLPATRETRSGEPLTSLPEVRLIGAEETDEVSVHCRTQCSALLTATCNGIPTQRTYGVAAEGVALFRLAAAEFPDAEAFDLHLTADGVESHFRYEVAETPVGSTVTVDMNGRERVFTIVGGAESDAHEGKISNESPVGKALIGAKVGDVVEVETQAGLIQYKVLEIQRSN